MLSLPSQNPLKQRALAPGGLDASLMPGRRRETADSGELGAGGDAAPAKTEATKKASLHCLQPAALDTTVREHDHEPYYQDNEGGIRNNCSPGAATRAKAHKPGYHSTLRSANSSPPPTTRPSGSTPTSPTTRTVKTGPGTPKQRQPRRRNRG